MILSALIVYDEVDGVWKSMCMYDDNREVFKGLLDWNTLLLD